MDRKELIGDRVSVYYWRDDINCATASLKILGEVFGIPMNDQVLDAALGMHGAGEYGAQCGLVEGPLMFLGIWGRANGLPDGETIGWCREFARRFEERFGTLLCRELRPEGFGPHNPGHPCEPLTVQSIGFAVAFIESIDAARVHP
jgi:hypothetical protein